ncbi:suppressor of fused domain protein [Aneurinibacillus tyrosinisolvens]|uniref:suppressor of fused domain protein n=1 Tax=Aneurinibacillus tyrosinisolvens TaxID=1443435 RepID=UPI00069C0F47|nr:suppressor of fused domain protein [Aneurinibacillus tyrosinisolvens]
MRSNAEIFLERLEDLFGEADVIRKIDSNDGNTPIHVFFYYNLPEEGMLTSVTYGLSEGNHPEWKNGRPEIILTLETQDENWGLATAYFASQFRGEKSFSYASLFTLDTPISNESEMIGFFVFAPSIVDSENSVIKMPGKPINLVGMYPIYKEEIALYQSIGLEKFWHLENFDLYDVKRKNLGKKE